MCYNQAYLTARETPDQMTPTKNHQKTYRSLLLLMTFLTLFAIAFLPQTKQTSAFSPGQNCGVTIDPQKTILHLTQSSNTICGQLVALHGYYTTPGKPEVDTIALIPCNGATPLIFKVHPKHIVPFYRFRDVKIGKGKEICTLEYGCLTHYITSFKNYISLRDCAECEIKGLPPTWTQAPLTPYTPTPILPTRTPWPTRVSPSPIPTLSQDEITPTAGLFAQLYGDGSPTLSPGSDTLTGTGIPSSTATLISEITAEQPLYRRISPTALLILALLVFLLPLISFLREYFIDR